jgi:fluoride ion exporter CrcB/FEX
LTTFSTFALETTNALGGQDNLSAFLSVAANNLLGVALVLLGMWVVKLR